MLANVLAISPMLIWKSNMTTNTTAMTTADIFANSCFFMFCDYSASHRGSPKNINVLKRYKISHHLDGALVPTRPYEAKGKGRERKKVRAKRAKWEIYKATEVIYDNSEEAQEWVEATITRLFVGEIEEV